MAKIFLVILIILANPALAEDQDQYLNELVTGVAQLTRGNIFFPDQCHESSVPAPVAMSDHPACTGRVTNLANAITPVENEVAIKDLIAEKKPKLVVIGETHGSPSALRFPETMHAIKKSIPDMDCLFVEYPASFLVKLQELQEKGTLPLDSEENIEAMVSQNQILAAGRLGLKIIPIDNHPMRQNKELALSPEGFRNRNKIMAEEIDKKLADGTCKAAVLIVGAFHWTHGGPSSSVPSLKDLIESKTASILTVNTSCHPTMPPPQKDPIWFWNVCKDNPKRLDVEAKVETRSLPDSVTLVPDGGKWNDFDIGLVTAPTYDENCRRTL